MMTGVRMMKTEVMISVRETCSKLNEVDIVSEKLIPEVMR